jgi:NADH:ubiquinone oxidoreductase subunit H
MSVCEIEYNLFFLCVFSGCFSFLVVVIGFLSNNKYAILASGRAILINLNLEVLFGFLLVSLSVISNSISFLSLTA